MRRRGRIEAGSRRPQQSKVTQLELGPSCALKRTGRHLVAAHFERAAPRCTTHKLV